jgi:integrase
MRYHGAVSSVSRPRCCAGQPSPSRLEGLDSSPRSTPFRCLLRLPWAISERMPWTGLGRTTTLSRPQSTGGMSPGWFSPPRTASPLDPRTFNRRFASRCHAAGAPQIRVHDTRRTCASLLAALDVHPRVAMQILRHSQISVTMNVYTEVSSARAGGAEAAGGQPRCLAAAVLRCCTGTERGRSERGKGL